MPGERTRTKAPRDLDFAGFAQEFLRRNPAYRRDYHSISQRPARPPGTVEQEVMARRWGLCFPVPARRRPDE
jgi:hypothetical protein